MKFASSIDWPLGLEAYLDSYDIVGTSGHIDLSSDKQVHILLLRNEDEGPKSPLIMVVDQSTKSPETVEKSLERKAHRMLFDWYVKYDPDYLWGIVDEIKEKPLRKDYLAETFTWFVWTLDPANEKTLPLLKSVKSTLEGA